MKKRLDIMMVEQGLAPSREKAKAYIMAGEVYVNGQKEDKAGSMFAERIRVLIMNSYFPAGRLRKDCQAGGKRKDSSLCQQRRTEAGKSHEKFRCDT